MTPDDFVGLPFRVGARGPDAFDCYGIVAEVLRRARGVALPDWYQGAPGQQAASRAVSAALAGEVSEGRAVLVAAPEEFDIAIVGGFRRAHHVGIVLQGGILHSTEQFGCIWQGVSRFCMLFNQTEFYRWQP